MHLRLATLIATLCVTHVSAASLQPAEAGLQPLHDRVAAIQVEEQALNLKLQEPNIDAKTRAAAHQRFKEIDAEKHRLEEAIEKAKAFAQAPLVLFAMPLEQGHD